MENILLATVNTLPKLINGKVCVINNNNIYNLYKPVHNCIIKDYFNPFEYSILISKKYNKCIIYANIREQEDFLVNQQIQELKTKSIYKVGDKIHIHSKQGIYTIEKIVNCFLIISCKKWQHEDIKNQAILKSDFKCLAGGIKNFKE